MCEPNASRFELAVKDVAAGGDPTQAIADVHPYDIISGTKDALANADEAREEVSEIAEQLQGEPSADEAKELLAFERDFGWDNPGVQTAAARAEELSELESELAERSAALAQADAVLRIHERSRHLSRPLRIALAAASTIMAVAATFSITTPAADALVTSFQRTPDVTQTEAISFAAVVAGAEGSLIITLGGAGLMMGLKAGNAAAPWEARRRARRQVGRSSS